MKILRLFFIVFIFSSVLRAEFNTDLKIMYAMDLRENGHLEQAADELYEIYNYNKKPVYLKFALSLYNESSSTKFIPILNYAKNILGNDPEFLRLEAVASIKAKDFRRAREILENLVKKQNQDNDKRILASVYMLQGEKKKGLSMLKNMYSSNKSMENLTVLVEILMAYKQRDKEAKNYFLEYYDKNGCDYDMVCMSLAEIYAIEKNPKRSMQLYDEIFLDRSDYLRRAIEVMVSTKNFEYAIELLNRYDEENYATRMRIYSLSGKVEQASRLAGMLYERTGNPQFLAEQAIYEYEANQDRMTPQTLKDISKKFKDSISKGANEPNILNYFGYILISNDIDVKEGIKLVTQALQRDPNSPYYLDSLAWGLYKMKECKNAEEIMLKAVKSDPTFLENQEAVEHLRAIKKCLEETK